MRLRFYTAAILCASITGVWTSSVSGDVHVKGMLSTGQVFDGKLMKDDGLRVMVKETKRTNSLMAVNMVECTVTLTNEKLPADIDGLSGSGLANFMLTKGHKFLAEVTFLCALTKTASTDKDGGVTLSLWKMEKTPWEKVIESSQMPAIKAMYTDARLKLPVRLGGKKLRTWRPRRYQLPDPKTITGVLKQMDDWGLKMRQIAPKTHGIETAHFRIYSSWARSDDTRLRGIYEKLYAALCKQFDIAPTENIWIGKLPVYAFWKKEDFVIFGSRVCGVPSSIGQQAGGYAGRRGAYQYVSLGPVMIQGMSKANAKTWFYELLVHETTHAFFVRYINSNNLVNWLNEGIAEMLSATFVPKGGTSRKLKAAHAMVRAGHGAQVLSMMSMRNIPMESSAYGAAQSLARFLVFKGKAKFIELVYEIKSGTSSEESLKKVYGLTHKQLVQQWVRKVK
jgi:hypothetical protein